MVTSLVHAHVYVYGPVYGNARQNDKKKVKIKRLFVVISILKKAPVKLSSYCVRVTVFITIKNPSKKPRF